MRAGLSRLPTRARVLDGAPPAYALDGGVYAAGSAVNWARAADLFPDRDEIASFDGPASISRGIAFVPALAGLA